MSENEKRMRLITRPLAGSTRQILAMCEVHWRTCGTWQLLTHDPREEADGGMVQGR